MAEHRSTAAPEEAPPMDASAIERAYRLHRARRRARSEHRRATRRAGRRFWLGLIVLIVACVVLAVASWHEIQHLFGL